MHRRRKDYFGFFCISCGLIQIIRNVYTFLCSFYADEGRKTPGRGCAPGFWGSGSVTEVRRTAPVRPAGFRGLCRHMPHIPRPPRRAGGRNARALSRYTCSRRPASLCHAANWARGRVAFAPTLAGLRTAMRPLARHRFAPSSPARLFYALLLRTRPCRSTRRRSRR